MGTRSRIALGMVVKNFRRLAKHPWIGGKLATLQGEKWLFNLLYPRAQTGEANKIRQLSFRITDLCNLRCHTCGQWGDQGFLHGQNLRNLKRSEVPLERYLEVLGDLTSRPPPLCLPLGRRTHALRGLPRVDRGGQRPEAAHRHRHQRHPGGRGCRALGAGAHVSPAAFHRRPRCHPHNQARPGVGGADNFADIQAALAAVGEAKRAHGSTLPLVASLTTISQTNFRHLVDIYEAFRDKVDLFVFYLSWWIDAERCEAHEVDFRRRFGFTPVRPRGWVGGWKPDDYRELNRQLEAVLERSRPGTAPAVTLIPSITGEDNLRSYYTDHGNYFGFNQCISIYQAVEVNSNGDLSPCRDYHDYVVGNIKEATITELWNSPAYRKFRQSLATEGLMPVCSRCCGLMGY